MPLKTIINGIDVDRQRASESGGARPVVTAPSICTDWVGGTQTCTSVSAGGGGSPVREFAIHSDYPEALLGSGTAPSPLDLLIAAVGASFVTSFVLAAAEMKVRIESMRASVSLEDQVAGSRRGIERPDGSIVLIAETDAAASAHQLHRVCQIAIERSPVVALCRLNVRVEFKPAEGNAP